MKSVVVEKNSPLNTKKTCWACRMEICLLVLSYEAEIYLNKNYDEKNQEHPLQIERSVLASLNNF